MKNIIFINFYFVIMLLLGSTKMYAITESIPANLVNKVEIPKKPFIEKLKEKYNLYKPNSGNGRSFGFTLGMIALIIAIFFLIVYFLPVGTVPFHSIPFKNPLLDASFWALIGILLMWLGK